MEIEIISGLLVGCLILFVLTLNNYLSIKSLNQEVEYLRQNVCRYEDEVKEARRIIHKLEVLEAEFKMHTHHARKG